MFSTYQTLVLFILTLTPLLSRLSFHSLSLVTNSSSVSAITAKSSAYSSSHGRATLNSLDMASMTLNLGAYLLLPRNHCPHLLQNTTWLLLSAGHAAVDRYLRLGSQQHAAAKWWDRWSDKRTDAWQLHRPPPLPTMWALPTAFHTFYSEPVLMKFHGCDRKLKCCVH